MDERAAAMAASISGKISSPAQNHFHVPSAWVDDMAEKLSAGQEVFNDGKGSRGTPLCGRRKQKSCPAQRRGHFGNMKPAAKFKLVLVTAPDLKTGRSLAKAALAARLAACANLVPKMESHYWWRGKMERGAEVLLIFKTTSTRLAALEKLVIEL